MAKSRSIESGVPLYTQNSGWRPETPATTWKPPLTASLLKSLSALVILLAAEGAIAIQFRSRDYDLGSFLLGLLAFLITCLLIVQAYSLYCLLQTSYILGPRNLTIICGGVRYVLALGGISNVATLGTKTHSLELKAARSPLLGYPIRGGSIDSIGDVTLFCTSNSLADMALIGTADGTIAVSPADKSMFIDELNARRAGLQFQPSPVAKSVPRLARFTFWSDRLAHAIFLIAVAGNLVVYGYVSYKFPGLPPLLPLHFNSVGEIDFIGTRMEAFKIPAIGTAAVLADLVVGIGVHAREKLATRLLLTVAVVVQVILLVAVVKII